MKRRHLLLAVPGAVLVRALSSSVAAAQDEPSAADLVSAVQAFYAARRTIRARFAQHYWSRAHQHTWTSRGRLAVERPGRVSFDYDPPNGRVVVCDGDSGIVYEPIEGGPGQYARGSAAMARTTAMRVLMGSLDASEYRVSLRAPRPSDPQDTRALVLAPLRPEPHLRRLVLHVDARPETRGTVRRVGIEDPDGNWNTFELSDLEFDRALDPGTFRFTPPPGAREIERPRGA